MPLLVFGTLGLLLWLSRKTPGAAPAQVVSGAWRLPARRDLAVEAVQEAMTSLMFQQVGAGHGGGGGGHGGGGGGGGGGWHGGGGRGIGWGGGGGGGWWGPYYPYAWPPLVVPTYTAAPSMPDICAWALRGANSSILRSLISQYASQPQIVACLSQRLAQIEPLGF